MNEETEFNESKAKNQLKDNERRKEVVKLALEDPYFRNRRRFLTYFDGDGDILNDIGLISDGKGGTPIVIDRYNEDSWVPIGGEETEEEAEEFLEGSLEELKEAGYEVPFRLSGGKLWEKVASHNEWLDEVCANIRFQESDKSSEVDREEFGFPLVTRMSKKFSIPGEAREWLENEFSEELEDVSTDFVESFDEIQGDISSGLFTAITKENESIYRWAYPELRKSGLNEREVADVLQEVEEEVRTNSLTRERLSAAIAKIRDKGSGEEVAA